MFDLGKDVTVEAVIKEVQFTNPHVWLQILVKDEKGVETEWSIESGVQPQLQGLEVQPVLGADDDLPVDHAALR